MQKRIAEVSQNDQNWVHLLKKRQPVHLTENLIDND